MLESNRPISPAASGWGLISPFSAWFPSGEKFGSHLVNGQIDILKHSPKWPNQKNQLDQEQRSFLIAEFVARQVIFVVMRINKIEKKYHAYKF